MKRKILVVEDDAALARVLCDNLTYEDFEVTLAQDGASALRTAEAVEPDLVLLDMMLPGISGLDVCDRLSRNPASSPAIIILTARNRKEDKLRGFRAGADDYVTKPFTLDELLARVRAVLRRTRPIDDTLVLGPLTFDFRHYSATCGEQPVSFTQHELEVLHYMSERSGRIVTRDELLQHVWGYQNVPVTRCVDNLIARLRTKIEDDPHHPRYIQTVHGDGYRLTPDR